MRLAVTRENLPGELRVALAPESVKKLVGAGFAVTIESHAGATAHFSDAAYAEAGATVAKTRAEALADAALWVRVNPPVNEVDQIPEKCMVLGALMPMRHLDMVRALAARGVTAFSTDAIPRIARAQAMDTLSSMANLAGYRGALLAAGLLSRFTPMLTTAAGTILPAKYFVIGAGVAGLQAIATARRLGANVFATDVRPEVKEQIESVGAKYVGIELKQSASAGGGYAAQLSAEDQARQRELLVAQCAVSDVVITTALIGGMFAPKLISAEMVTRMRPGSVIMDLAAEGGGNCELSEPGATVVRHDVTIAAPLNVPSGMATHASLLWSRNMTNFLMSFWKDKKFTVDMNDEIMKGAAITHEGKVTHPGSAKALAAAGQAGASA